MFPSWNSIDELREWQDWADGISHWWPIGIEGFIFVVGACWATYNRCVDKRIDALEAIAQAAKDESDAAEKAAMKADASGAKKLASEVAAFHRHVGC